MKWEAHLLDGQRLRPTPHGVGGLKSGIVKAAVEYIKVPPLTGWVD